MMTISAEAYKEAEQEIERLCEEAKYKHRLNEKTFKLVEKARECDCPVGWVKLFDYLKKENLINVESHKILNNQYLEEKKRREKTIND